MNFKQKLLYEFMEINNKISKAKAIIDSPKLNSDEKLMLENQIYAMDSYSSCLASRLDYYLGDNI